MPPTTALVFAGGDPVPSAVAERLPSDALVIGADSGVEHARVLGRRVDVAVGDFDSISPGALADVEAGGAEILRYPADKDATDLDLAIGVAMTKGAAHVTVVGGHGGRVDHELANALLLGSPRFARIDVDAWFGPAHLTVVRRPATLTGAVGSLVTLLACDGPATGVTTTGLRFALTDATVLPGSTLGVSNELVAGVATVTVGSGALLAVQPDALGDHLGKRA